MKVLNTNLLCLTLLLRNRALGWKNGDLSTVPSVGSVKPSSVRLSSIQASSFSSSSTYAASAVVSIVSQASWTNETFAIYLCGNMSANPLADGISVTGFSGANHELPDCFYAYSGGLSSYFFSSLVIRGNSTFPDPLQRLHRSLSPTPYSSLISDACSFVAESGALSIPNWPAIFAPVPSNSEGLSILRGNFAPGSFIPSVILKTKIFSIMGCNLSGTIPSGLFSAYAGFSFTTLSIDLTNNQINGSIPADLFHSWTPTELDSLTINLDSNQISGTLPANLFTVAMPKLTSFRMTFDSNALTGNIPPLIAPSALTDGVLAMYTVVYSNNLFTGSIPSIGLTGKTSGLRTVAFSCMSNMLSGTIPSNLISSVGPSLQAFSFYLSYNRLTGGLPSGLFNLGTAKISTWWFEAAYNLLDGTLASNLFASLDWSNTASAIFSVANNQLTGDLPSVFMTDSNTPVLASAKLTFTGNLRLAGTVPPSFLRSLQNVAPAGARPKTTIAIYLDNTSLTGAFIVPDWTGRLPSASLSVYASQANFTSISLPQESINSMSVLNFGNNNHLTGELPSYIFSSTELVAVSFRYTRLSGVFPKVPFSSQLRSLDLSSTEIDFCTNNTSWTSMTLTSCALYSTNAITCSSSYPSVCETSNPIPWTAPTPPPVLPPSDCPNATRPSLDFVCINSIWVFQGEYTAPVLTIPGGASQTIVSGNVSSSTVVIGGLGSTLTIQGCADNLTMVTIELTAEELKKLSTITVQQLISLDANCSSLAGVQVEAKITGSTCKKLKVTKVAKEQSFSAVFTLDNSGCRTWWIVLAAVLGSCVLLALIFVILVIFVAPVRHCIRPYSKRAAVDSEASLPKGRQ